jgi:hypothetical protein
MHSIFTLLMAGAAFAQTGAPTGVRFTRFTDPQEHSFSMDVPVGWHTQGGLARTGLIGIQPYLRSLSPDKMTYLLFGEPSMPNSFAPYTQFSRQLGYREGQMYNAGLGQRVKLLRYTPGAAFARGFGETALEGLCRDVRPAGAVNLPDLARKTQGEDRSVIPSRYYAGEATFTCMHHGQEMQASIRAVTWITNDSMMWAVVRLYRYIAPRQQAQQTASLVDYMLGTVKFDDRWVQFQSSLSQQAGEEIKRRVAMFERQQAEFNAKLNAVDTEFESFDEVIKGFSSYRDPATGNTYMLNNLAPNKWANDSGRIVGTLTDNPPLYGNFHRVPRISQ